MFSSFTSFISAAESQVKKLIVLDDQYSEAPVANSEPLIPVQAVAIAPWDDPPKQLRDRASEWKVLVEGVLHDENTYVIPPSRILAASSPALQRLEQLGELVRIRDEVESPVSVPTSFVDGVLSSSTIQELRYSIVPRFVIETHFWENAYWRITVLRGCQSIQAALDLIDVLNTETSARTDVRKRNIGSWDNASHLASIRDKVRQEFDRSSWAQSKASAVREAIASASSSCQLISSLVAKRDASELGESVLESCKYHKVKVAALLGELGGAEAAVGTDLDPNGGELHTQLENLNEQLRACIAAFGEMKAGVESEGVLSSSPQLQRSPSGVGPGVVGGEDRIGATVLLSGSAEGGSATRRDISGNTGGRLAGPATTRALDDDVAFNAEMPWDDDEE